MIKYRIEIYSNSMYKHSNKSSVRMYLRTTGTYSFRFEINNANKVVCSYGIWTGRDIQEEIAVKNNRTNLGIKTEYQEYD